MIYTSYFARQKKMELGDAAYISIAVGNPKYRVPYEIIDFKMLKPYGIFGRFHGEEYKKKYFERLDNYGADAIRKEMFRLSKGHKDIILMCHEKDKNECHRVMFSEWWEKNTGEVIPEYGEENEQLTIFDI